MYPGSREKTLLNFTLINKDNHWQPKSTTNASVVSLTTFTLELFKVFPILT